MKSLKDYNNLTQEDLNDEFMREGRAGNLEVVRYLCTSPDMTLKPDFHAYQDTVLEMACLIGNAPMAKLLLNLPNFKEGSTIHKLDDNLFKNVALNSMGGAMQPDYLDILNALIFDYKIEETDSIKNFIKNLSFVQNMFSARSLNEALEKSSTVTQKNKI